MNLNTINDIASELFLALKNQETVQPLSDKYDEIDINDAYQISRKFLSLREDQGEKPMTSCTSLERCTAAWLESSPFIK